MCGVGGIIKITPAGEAATAALAVPAREAIPEAWLDVLDESIRHRGPDGQGRFRDRVVRADGSVVDVALVHRRLSIIDHGGGAQPMVSVLGTSPLRGEPIRGTSPLRGESAFSPARSAISPLLFHGKPNAPVVYEQMRGTGMLPAGSSGSTGILPVHSPAHGQDAHATTSQPELAMRGGGAPSDLVAVVFNGCIYNHRDLRKELLSAGHEFKTDHSDTEVLLHGWREWGEGLFEKLDGMFALAIWDRFAASLTLARDAFGEKPLYFARGTDQSGDALSLTFCSSAAALARFAMHSAVPARYQRVTEGIREWVRFGFAASPPSEYVHSVLPSGVLVENYEGCRSARHGPVFAGASPPARTRTIDAAAVENALETAVRRRCEADVPVGCFLSGGIDSSLVALSAHRGLGALQTYCVRMPGGIGDESAIASEVAAIIGTDHTTLECHANPATDLQRLIPQIGLPFGDSSLLPAHWVSSAAREHTTVALAGDGGDEMFLGYERYRAAALLARHRALLGMLDPLLRSANSGSRRSIVGRAARVSAAARGLGYTDIVSIYPSRELRRLFPSAIDFGVHDDRWRGAEQAVLWDLQCYLPDDLMRKVDAASMAIALEVRSPFLGKDIALMCMSASLNSLMPRGQRKGLLRQVARKYFPAEIVDRPKQGFAIPIGEWFRSDYGGMKQLLMDHLNSTEPWGPPRLGIELNMKFVRQMVDEHMNQRRDHSQRLYMLLVLSIWAKWMGSLGG